MAFRLKLCRIREPCQGKIRSERLSQGSDRLRSVTLRINRICRHPAQSPPIKSHQTFEKDLDVMAVFVLVHGGSHGSWCWDACAKELQCDGHQTVSFDLPGHGQDRTPRDRVTLKAYAQAIRDQLKQCSPEPPVLVGHSLAGIAIASAMANGRSTEFPKAGDRLTSNSRRLHRIKVSL